MQQRLHDQFKMIDLGDISYYLKMQINQVVSKKITFCQSIYLKKVLNRFKLTKCKPASIPIDPRVANSLLSYNKNADKKIIK